MTGLQLPRSKPEHGKGTPGAASPVSGFRCLLVVWAFLQLPATAAGAPWPVRVLHRLVAPFRSNPFLLESATPCGLGLAACFLPNSSPESTGPASKFEPAPETGALVEEEIAATAIGDAAGD